MNKTHLGYQKTIDFYGCDPEKINSKDFIEQALLKAASIMNLTVINTTIHEFSPIGISGVIVIQESHIAIHTWPEHSYVALDVFTCNQSYSLESGMEWLKNAFKATHYIEEDIKRGALERINALNAIKNEN
ncbi:adenosylmethionine decarboxylase [Dokdonia sp.]|uniref:adenosylmethionine decarboxylase n=1 Tax=Dokdonia sp. TaxID=2024995 RepID=UPI00326433B9